MPRFSRKVVIPALAAALKSGHLGGAAVDVYPKEPHSNSPGFETELRGCPNTILTPHIGGSTEEAQLAIGMEVSNYLIKFVNNGTTLGSVNFPENDLRVLFADFKGVRVLNIHHNVPGVLKVLCARRFITLLHPNDINMFLSTSKSTAFSPTTTLRSRFVIPRVRSAT